MRDFRDSNFRIIEPLCGKSNYKRPVMRNVGDSADQNKCWINSRATGEIRSFGVHEVQPKDLFLKTESKKTSSD